VVHQSARHAPIWVELWMLVITGPPTFPAGESLAVPCNQNPFSVHWYIAYTLPLGAVCDKLGAPAERTSVQHPAPSDADEIISILLFDFHYIHARQVEKVGHGGIALRLLLPAVLLSAPPKDMESDNA
jgi:hypothetical protein